MRTFIGLNFAVNALLPAIAQLIAPGLITAAINAIASQPTCWMQPPNFPQSIPISNQDFENWGETIYVRNLWKVVPRTSYDVVILANWALENNYTIRPLGKMHSWSPLTVTTASNCRNTLLVDTTKYLTGIEVFPDGIENYTFPVVKAESGVLLEDLLAQLELRGFGFTSCAAIGKITLGGLFAINGHGTGIKVANSSQHLKNYGSVINRIVQIQAVVWNNESKSYSLQTFDRSMHEVSALMTHIGLAFITSMTLRVEENYNLRCISLTDIPNSELFANPLDGQNARTISSFLENYGRVLVTSHPYVNFSWLMLCSNVETCPAESRQVNTPYNYPFLKGESKVSSDLAAAFIKSFTIITPIISNLAFSNIKTQLHQTGSEDICGASKNLLLFIEPDNLRLGSFSYAILTNVQQIQQIIHMLKNKVDSTLQEYQGKLSFPLNGLMDMRITGVDDPNDISPEAKQAFLAVTTPAMGYPEFDIVIWIDFLTVEGTPGSLDFFQALESYFVSTFNGTLGLSRPEWSKGWAATQSGLYTNISLMHNVIANRYEQWSEFVKVCNDLDPHKIFRNEFLNQLFI